MRLVVLATVVAWTSLTMAQRTRAPVPAPHSEFRAFWEMMALEVANMRSSAKLLVEKHGNQVVDDLAASVVKWMVKLPAEPADAAQQKVINRQYEKIGELFNRFARIGVDRVGDFVYTKGDVPVRIGRKDDGLVLMITGLDAARKFNIMRLPPSERINRVVQDTIFPTMPKFDGLFDRDSFKHFAVSVLYGSEDFGEEGTYRTEMLVFVAPARACADFAAMKIADADFLRASEAYILDRAANSVRRTELSVR